MEGIGNGPTMRPTGDGGEERRGMDVMEEGGRQKRGQSRALTWSGQCTNAQRSGRREMRPFSRRLALPAAFRVRVKFATSGDCADDVTPFERTRVCGSRVEGERAGLLSPFYLYRPRSRWRRRKAEGR